MKKLFVSLLVLFCSFISAGVQAQEIDLKALEKLDLKQLFGKKLTVKKGFSPDFYLGNVKIASIDAVEKILGFKKSPEINKLFRTFKTGRTVYRVASYTGAAITVYGAVRGAINNAKDSSSASTKDAALTAVYAGLSSVATGVLVKMLTKGASYKAVDLFGGAVRKKLGDIFKVDIGLAPQYNGTTGLKAGLKIAL
ncbi:hypothetical protein V9K67_06260 [Paraflavisolibacter sp. H34]|uniref:hypothetical protein n=1 Tax=Huijunlia imazamoxiresistens TaxID=3127457 RepID=UPI003015E6AD